ncbi:hypothetical protein VB620_03980 [Nodularia harveyana UHCC-0300]|uniref:Molecular chaperone n=1 Tax=Nodularia harveyana UHCC-0300 TaxID=2974287 RepID=A0ABU5UBK2_9CYAN|nr:hypothetical protein [Nodularia harveyana]MEA5580500.1 hypothetical protein [Nodularia harveyana UHCC-0300]
MTSRADEIQKLIADIDNLLNNSSKRLSRLLSHQAPETKEVLEKTRNFLVQQKEREIVNNSDPEPEAQRSPLLEKFVNKVNNQSLAQPNPTEQEQVNLLLQQLIQPFQAELAAMMEERANLVQEIRQLEQRRLHNYSLSQQWANQEQMIAEFLQLLISRIPSNLTPQTGANSDSENQPRNTELVSSESQSFLETSEQAERLTHLTRELDQRLLSLDGTVNFVFEALQRNINTYHESLYQGLARMHSRGVQGEQLMVKFLNNLTQLLQQQVPMAVLSFSELENNQPLSPLPSLPTEGTSIAKNVIPSVDTTTQPQELNTPEASSSLIFNEEDMVVADDLDAMLLELGVDDYLSSSYSDSAEQQDDLDLIGDEVDQLYASLLGTDDFYNASFDVESLSSNISETTPAIDGLEPEVIAEDNISETTPAIDGLEPEVIAEDNVSETTPAIDGLEPGVIAEDNVSEATPAIQPREEIPDPWFETPEIESESWRELFFEEDSNDQEELTTDLSGSSSTEVVLAENLEMPPTSADTITSLSELFGNVVAEKLVVKTAAVNTPEQNLSHQSEVVVDVPEQRYVDNYISASPTENLLSPEESQSVNLPDITLDEQQIQQLNQDLDTFDDTLPPDVDLDIFADFESSIDQPIVRDSETLDLAESDMDVFQVNPISWPQTEADLDFSPSTEKLGKVKKPEIESSVISISDSGNDPDVGLSIQDSRWYLGLDVGTTGISAALLNRSHSVVYPICWSADNVEGVTAFPPSFRLPAEVYLPSDSVPPGEAGNVEVQEMAEHQKHNFYSVQLKPYLQVAIPYKNEEQQWEPVLQFNKFSAGPLVWVVRSLSKLLLTLKSDRHSTTQGLIASAVGLSVESFYNIINNLAGVICSCPSGWSEQYRFNLREAVLTSKLVKHPQQVFFVEEAIASLLSILDHPNGQAVQISDSQGLHPAKLSDDSVVGNTFVINIGATTTEMALVDIPENGQQLTHNNFMLHSFAYASNGIEQDIICQLLLPPKYRQSRELNQEDSQTDTTNSWQWQTAIPDLDQMQWDSLGLEELDLPQLGEPDTTARIRLQQRLESSLLGQAVLDAALALKLILQQQDSYTLELADQKWVLQRKDLENQVFIPFVRRLNREFNKLLVARGIPTEAINQAVLTGGVASLGAVNNWLRQKLPNTKIIQDSYLGENGAPRCSRVAYGLAMLPLHPQVLEEPKQQYTDYFLFMELLRLLPDRTLSFDEVRQLFEGSGINTSICQQRLLAFMEGELPAGLIPAKPNDTWVSHNSQNNSDYLAIASAPLFEKQGNLTYRPNSTQVAVVRRYLNAIKASTKQPMEEPYTVNLALQVNG